MLSTDSFDPACISISGELHEQIKHSNLSFLSYQGWRGLQRDVDKFQTVPFIHLCRRSSTL